jgi:hydroxymethylbilane synthase
MPEARVVRLGTRGSRLARWQTEHVIARLRDVRPDVRCEPVTFSTLGDRVPDVALPRVGDRGLFTRDLEEALREGAIDAAVHSLKDLPTEMPPGLHLGAVLERADPREVLVTPGGTTLDRLPRGARIGTSSVRRRSQLLGLRPDLTVVDIRGNVPTRVDKVMRGDYDGTLLAFAGLQRLGLLEVASEVFDPDAMLPAPGQGALAVQVRADDTDAIALVSPLDHRASRLATAGERGVLSALHGGCQAPLGTAAAWAAPDELRIAAVVAAFDGATSVRAAIRGTVHTEPDAVALAERVAAHLLSRGAAAILDDCRRALSGATVAAEGGDR